MRFLIVDIETTGLSCSNDKITAIGTIVYNSESPQIHEERCFNVAKARKCGSIQDIETMQKEVVHLFDLCDRIVAFNGINFDFPFIVKWLGAHYVNAPANSNTLTLGCESLQANRGELTEEHTDTTEEHITNPTDKHTNPTEEHTSPTVEHTDTTEKHADTTEKHTDTTEKHTDTTEKHTNTTEKHTDTTEKNTDTTEKNYDTTEKHTNTTEKHTTNPTEEHTSPTKEHTDTTKKHTDATIEHEKNSCTDFVNSMQTIHELNSSGTRRVAGINNTARHIVWPSKYVDFCLMSLEYTNKYISLKNLCGMNCVKAVKSGTGLDAIGFAEREQWPELEHYCQQDVRVLLELTQRAVSHGLKYPCHGYTSCEDLVHVIFDKAMISSVKSADIQAGTEMSIFQAIPKKYQRACPQKRPKMP